MSRVLLLKHPVPFKMVWSGWECLTETLIASLYKNKDQIWVFQTDSKLLFC